MFNMCQARLPTVSISLNWKANRKHFSELCGERNDFWPEANAKKLYFSADIQFQSLNK